MNLNSATKFLHRAPDAATWIRLADGYIQSRNKMGARFVLPEQHSVLAPVIDNFADDPGAFVE